MRARTVALVVVLTAVAQVGPAVAQGQPRMKDPYGRLFTAQTRDRKPDPQPKAGETRGAVAAAKQPTTLCGTTLWKVDPKVDQRMSVPPADKTTDFKLRRFDSPECRP